MAEGRQAEPHTHIRKQKETHELIFSCVSWLAVLLVGAYARRRRRRRRRWWSRATWRPYAPYVCIGSMPSFLSGIFKEKKIHPYQQTIAEVDLTFLIRVALKQSESKNLQPKK